MKIYLAGSIFYYGDVLRNSEWAKKIRDAFPNVDLYSPIENTDINGAEGKKKFAGSQLIADGDNSRLDNTDILIACIDGDVLPSGTCAEIGVMREKIRRGDHKYIVGICTDNRQCYLTHSAAKDEGGAAALGEQQYSYQNLYVTGLIKQSGVLVSNIEDAIAFIKSIELEYQPPTITGIINYCENPNTYGGLLPFAECEILLSNKQTIIKKFTNEFDAHQFLNTTNLGDVYHE